jgi:mannitol-1-phosphate 5-dehydrogenase
MNNLHFGAGNIGRGFIGLLLNQQGFDVTFVDVNEAVVRELQRRQSYEVEVLSTPPKKLNVNSVNALYSLKDEQKIIEKIQNAELITTSVGVKILPLIAPLIAKGLALRSNTKPLHVIACENALSASSLLEKEVQKHIDKIPSNVAFPNAAVDRIVPQQNHEDVLFVQVEPFFEWVIETKSMLSTLPLKDVLFVEDLAPYIERKLFTVNSGHCATAYFGYQKGFKTISEAIADPETELFVRLVLIETGLYLTKTYGLDSDTHQQYIDKTIERFKNVNIIDEVVRVGRSPLRKLSYNDRLVKPARELIQIGHLPKALVEAIAYGLLFQEPTDTEAVEIQERIKTHLGSAVSTITGIPVTDPLHIMIVEAFERLSSSS